MVIQRHDTIPSVIKFNGPEFNDERGHFKQVFVPKEFKRMTGIEFNMKELNESYTENKYTIRGMHVQRTVKLSKIVWVEQGKVLDVFIDMNKDSNTYGRMGAMILEEGTGMLYVPSGFLHGFMTLDDSVIFKYLYNADYVENYNLGVNPLDEPINHFWYDNVGDDWTGHFTMSDKDKNAMSLEQFELAMEGSK